MGLYCESKEGYKGHDGLISTNTSNHPQMRHYRSGPRLPLSTLERGRLALKIVLLSAMMDIDGVTLVGLDTLRAGTGTGTWYAPFANLNKKESMGTRPTFSR